MADGVPSIEELKKLRVVDLKDRLQAIGLTSSGLKADLVQRLHDHYVEESGGAMAPPQEMVQLPPEGMMMPPGGMAMQMDPQAQMLEQQRLMELQQQEEQQRLLMQQQQEQQRMMMEQQQRQQQEEQRQMMLERQRQEEQQRLMLEQQEQQQRQQQEDQQRMMAEQQRQQQEEQQRMMAEQQRQQQEEQQRLMMEQQRQQDEQQRFLQQQRLLEQQRQEEERQRVLEQQRLLEEQRQREDQQRMMEQQRAMEQQRLVEQQRAQEEEERRRRDEEQQRQLMEQQQRVMMEQQKEAMARQQAAMLEEEQRRQEQEAMMQKARQQQQLFEAAKQMELAEQQRLQEQKQREEAELMHQQQLALMEKQREEQNRAQQQQRPDQPKIPSLLSQDVIRPGPSHVDRHPPPLLEAPNRPPSLLTMDMPGPPMRRVEEPEAKEVKLPQALEQVLAFKGMRAQQVGIRPEEIEQEISEPSEFREQQDDDVPVIDEDVQFDEEEEVKDVAKTKAEKESKNKRKKKKKKRAKQRKMLDKPKEEPVEDNEDEKQDVEIEYVQEQLGLQPGDPYYHTFSKIFDAFKISEPEKSKDSLKSDEKKDDKAEDVKPRDRSQEDEDDSDDSDPEPEEDKPRLSKKKLKKLNRLSVAELKQLVARPDVVEMHDVTAQDPKLLVHLKATRNSVPVPRHWCFKRKYLQGKRGIEKAPFELPDYIKATGIMEMREALQEKEDQKTLKSKMRERVRPKMGKIDIDYQKLHDAFFRWQSKPKMTIHGDLYYEGKEFETRLKEKKPGNLTDDLRTALGMPLGQNAEKVPPPWLIAMQRYGPPPSYPNLKIPGLTAPIPEACSFGYHAGGWGKPPVDENGKPLYGDVFGTQGQDFQAPVPEESIDKALWGELESESESESESEAESEEDDADNSGLVTPGDAGLVTPSGLTSVPAGMETPDMIELRKRRIEDQMDQGGDTPALYQVLPEKKATVGGAMMGSAHVYDVNAAANKRPLDRIQTEGIDIDLNPEELDLDSAAMQAKYEQTLREQQSQIEKEDLSDMVAEHAAKQQKKRKKQQQDGGKAKKYKEFKF